MARAVVLLLLIIAAIGQSLPVVAQSPAPVIIEYWAWGEHIDVANAAKEEFEKLYPHITVKPVAMGAWDLHDRLLVALLAGVGAPDVSLLVQRRFQEYIETGRLLDISDHFMKYKDDFPKAVWEVVEHDGRIWGMPIDQTPAVLFYRKDIFAEHGIEVPIETWPEFIEIGKKLSDPRAGRYMTWQFVPAGGWGVSYYVMFLQSRGGNVFDDDGRVIRNNTLAKETLRWYYDLSAEHDIAFQAPTGSPAFYAALKDGRLLSYPNPAWGLWGIKEVAPELAGKWGVMPWPKWDANSPAYTGSWGGSVLTIPAQTKHPEEAKLWVEFLTARLEGQEIVWKVGNGVPAYLPALDAPFMLEPDPYLGGEVVYEAIRAREMPVFNFRNWAEAEIIIGNWIDRMFEGRVTPEDAWDSIEAELIRRFE